ncbi:nuclear protein MDM1 isoform X2 [Siphateles boraxobius]|uniref:nuclear protein MDM1 isoform X2 n=1 Tax=Siphateles boraxobius TaxID=180520 RepID=UPI004063D2DC
MPVHFKGISEYRSKYKSRTTRPSSDSPHRRMRLAGLSSDQSRITREPQFISKRKVLFYPPQVSSSFNWEGQVSSPQRQEKSRPVTPPAVTPVLRASSAEREVTPLAPRDLMPPEGTTAPSHQLQAEAQAAQTSTRAADQQRLNGINHALRKKAGLRSEQQRNGRLSSEYQRQFMWKTPVANSPLLAAHEMLYSNNRAIPPFKSNPVIIESEYKRSFKGSPPPRPLRLRRDFEQYEVPLLHTENTAPEKRKKKKERQHSRKSSPEEEVTYLQKQEMRSPCALRDSSPKAMRKVKTEYRSNFRSPIQYSYRDKAWVKVRPAKEEECVGFHEWYHEVRELREKAEAYRKRAWGTHFSRQHLNQILSDHNWMWEPSIGTSSSSIESEACRSTSSSPIIEALDLARGGSARASFSPGPSASVAASRRSSLGEDPTLPVQRKLAWGEEEGHGERNESEISQEEFTVEKNQWNPKDDHGNMKERNDMLQLLETESSLVVEGSEDAGRLPTPKLKTMQTVQRTHHDRTTPATGGALLVSPPKIKHSSKKVRRSEPPLGKPHSPYKHVIDGSPRQPHSKAENGSLQRSPPAAGITTVDLLPMGEDAWSEDEKAPDYTPHPRQSKPSQKQQTSHGHKAAVSPLPNRIQGMMRNPEFQHNGNLGIFRPELFLFPESDSVVSENDDKMSQISSRSAASCSVASELLGRAQRRKQEFWGKR